MSWFYLLKLYFEFLPLGAARVLSWVNHVPGLTGGDVFLPCS